MVEGGRLLPGQLPGEQGVVVSNLTRLGRVGYCSADHERPSGSTLTLKDIGHDEDDKVQCIVLMWKDEDTMPALQRHQSEGRGDQRPRIRPVAAQARRSSPTTTAPTCSTSRPRP